MIKDFPLPDKMDIAALTAALRHLNHLRFVDIKQDNIKMTQIGCVA